MQIKVSYSGGKRVVDALNESGYWICWLSPDPDGCLRLMSTAAPLSENGRKALAEKVSIKLGETVTS